MKYVVTFGDDVEVLAFAEEGEATEGTSEEEAPPNPVIPEPFHMAWAFGSFMILWALMHFVLLPPLLKQRSEREAKVLEQRQAAETARNAMQQVQDDYDASLASARAEADAIVEEARNEAATYRDQVMGEATAEASEARASAAAGIDASRSTALESIRGDVSEIAVSAASSVLGKDLDPAAQQAAIDAALTGGSK